MIDLKASFLGIAISVIVGGMISWLSGMNFVLSSLLVGGALVVNGLLAEWEDRRPNGFFNPKDSAE